MDCKVGLGLLMITGISGALNIDGNLVRTVRVRGQSDVTNIANAQDSSLSGMSLPLPTSNLNDAANANRCNIRWACAADSAGCGDTFTPSGDYVIDAIRVWLVPSIPAFPSYNLGDYFQSIALYKGTYAAGFNPGLAVSGTFFPGTSATDSPQIALLRVNYQETGQPQYEQADATYNQLWQVDFRNLGWQVSSGTTYAWGVYAAPVSDRLGFLHASYLQSQTSSGVFQFNPASGAITTGNGSCSGYFGKLSDLNILVFGHSAQ